MGRRGEERLLLAMTLPGCTDTRFPAGGTRGACEGKDALRLRSVCVSRVWVERKSGSIASDSVLPLEELHWRHYCRTILIADLCWKGVWTLSTCLSFFFNFFILCICYSLFSLGNFWWFALLPSLFFCCQHVRIPVYSYTSPIFVFSKPLDFRCDRPWDLYRGYVWTLGPLNISKSLHNISRRIWDSNPCQ